MPLLVPLAAEPSQEVNVTLSGQPCRLRVYARATFVPVLDGATYQADSSLYLDLYINDVLVLGGARCYDRTRLVRDGYFGLFGDLSFYDLYGTDDPTYDEIGSRFVLLYWADDEIVPATVVSSVINYTPVQLLDDDGTVLLDDDGVPLLDL